MKFRRDARRGSLETNRKCIYLVGLLLVLFILGNKVYQGEKYASDTRKEASKPEVSEPEVSICSGEGSFSPPSDIIIDYEKIRKMDKSPLKRVKPYTIKAYEKYMLDDAGNEHYTFLNYISATYGDCRHFTDIGTRYVASSLAAGSNFKTPIWTFDLPTSVERKEAFRGRGEKGWKKVVQAEGVQIKFHNVDLMKVSDEKIKFYLGTWFVMLDTFHEPDTVPFEREFFQRMIDIGFKGVLALDDIHLNSEMKKWWKELQKGAEKGGYKTYDITEIGHSTGTGLVDFSGKVTIKK